MELSDGGGRQGDAFVDGLDLGVIPLGDRVVEDSSDHVGGQGQRVNTSNVVGQRDSATDHGNVNGCAVGAALVSLGLVFWLEC